MAVSIYFYLFLLLVTQLLSANILTFALKNKRKITVAGEGGRRSEVGRRSGGGGGGGGGEYLKAQVFLFKCVPVKPVNEKQERTGPEEITGSLKRFFFFFNLKKHQSDVKET